MSTHRSIGDAWDGSSRRHFLALAAKGTAALAATTALSGCHVLGAAGKQGKLDFGDDFGVLNYAFTLEALEADFYRQVMRTPPGDLRAGRFDAPFARCGGSVNGSGWSDAT